MSKKITEITEQLVQPILAEKGLELIDIEFKKEGKNWFLRVFIDKQGGVDIEDCSLVSEELSQKLDEHDPIDMPYFLEVSSPGAERPLKKDADWKNAIGKTIFVSLYEQIDGQKEFEGRLMDYDGQEITLEYKQKTRVKTVTIPFNKIAMGRLAIVF